MTTIRTTCSRCGDVELTVSDISLELAAGAGTGRYVFECPFCESMEHRPANERVVSILLATGVEYEIMGVAHPITEAEIDVFAAALERDDWHSKLPAN